MNLEPLIGVAGRGFGAAPWLGVMEIRSIELWLCWATICACVGTAVTGCIFLVKSVYDIIREKRREKRQNKGTK